MANVQQLLDQLNASSPADKQLKLVGNGTPIEETTPVNVPADPANADPTLQTAHTVNRGTGRYYVEVVTPEGYTRSLPIKADPIKGGLEVPQSGVNDTVAATLQDTPEVQKKGTKPNPSLFSGDLKSLSWSQAGPIQDVPQTAKTPTATGNLDAIDAQGNVVPKGDPSAKQMRDPATGTTFNLVTDPKGELHDFGNDVYLVKPDGSRQLVGSVPEKQTSTIVPGVGLVSIDPNKPAGSRATVELATPTDPNNLGGVQVKNGVTYVPYNDPTTGKISYREAEGLPADTSVDHYYDDPNSRYVQLLDKQGNVIKQIDKGADWKPPVRVQPGTAPAADSVNPQIPTFDPTTGALKFIDNPNQVKASDATAELAKSLGVQLAAGSMSEDAAQKLITSAINTQNSQSQKIQAQAAATTAATGQQAQISTTAADVLRQAGTNATTGANLLQNRVTSATGALTSLVGSAAGSKMTSIPGGVGEGLVNGLSDWVTGLGGGQGVYDTAARMVQAADPKISQDPTLANQAQQTLGNMLALYQKQTGQPHPLVAATQAANASGANGGVTAPVTAPVTQPVVAPTPITPPVPAQGVSAGGFVAPISAAPGANYGAGTAYTGGVAPWLAQPQPSFVAPMIPT